MVEKEVNHCYSGTEKPQPVLSTGRTLCTAWAYITYRPREVGLA